MCSRITFLRVATSTTFYRGSLSHKRTFSSQAASNTWSVCPASVLVHKKTHSPTLCSSITRRGHDRATKWPKLDTLTLLYDRSTATLFHMRTSHTRAEPSSLPVARARPLGEKSTPIISSRWPSSVCTGARTLKSHIKVVQSNAADASTALAPPV